MKPREKVLIGLLVLVTAGVIYYQFFGGSLTGGPNTGLGVKDVVIPGGSGRINTGGMEGADAQASLGRNPFSFKVEIVTAPPPPPLPPPIPPPPPPPPPQPPRGGGGPTSTAAVVPNIPTIPLTYTGYARDDANELVAFLETNGQGGAPVGHYNLREDDFLLGRIRVNKITLESVEVEDMDQAENARNRKQSIPITPNLAPKK